VAATKKKVSEDAGGAGATLRSKREGKALQEGIKTPSRKKVEGGRVAILDGGDMAQGRGGGGGKVFKKSEFKAQEECYEKKQSLPFRGDWAGEEDWNVKREWCSFRKRERAF